MDEIEHFFSDGPRLFEARRRLDDRGFFSEVFRQDKFDALCGPASFVQDNHSSSRGVGVLRGLHFQRPPRAQGKLVRVAKGVVVDVAVDVREGSLTYGRHVMVELSSDRWNQFWVPPGFLHGFCTLTEDVELLYKVTDFYSPAHDGSVAFDDPDLDIPWPFPKEKMKLSNKDTSAPRLRDLPPPFPLNWDRLA